MAVNGLQPFVKVLDSNGVPIVGAVLHVYEVGTTTNRAIYSDAALSVPLTNPLSGVNASNASGDFPRFYMAAGTYKLRAEVTNGGTLIWEWDNIDTGTATGGTLPIASGGTGATTAAAALTALGAAAASDVTALSTQISTFTSALQNLISAPQGRLTLTSGTPVLSTGVTAGTSVFYTPYIGNLCPVYDGVQFNAKVFTELTLTLNSNYVLNSHYDCFIINDSGTIRIVTGPAWTTITAGSGARGAGAGTSELTRLNGLWVNANAMATARNGGSTFSVNANQGTYVGSLYIDGTAGQITCHTTIGQSRKWGVWNAYNRVPISLLAADASASWVNAPTTWRQSRADANNFIQVFAGLPEEVFDGRFVQQIQCFAAASNTSVANIGIGVNSTTVLTGQQGLASSALLGGTSVTVASTAEANATLAPTIGVNAFNMIEQATSGTTNNQFNGTSSNMLMTVRWRA